MVANPLASKTGVQRFSKSGDGFFFFNCGGSLTPTDLVLEGRLTQCSRAKNRSSGAKISELLSFLESLGRS